MAYVDPSQLTDGTVIDKDIWNQAVVNNTIFLYSPPFAQMTGTSTTYPNNTLSNVEFDTSDYDNDSMVDLANNQLTATTAGLYVVVGAYPLNTNAAGASSGLLYVKHSNGNIIASSMFEASAPGAVPGLTVTGQVFLEVGESVVMQIYHSSGATMSTSANNTPRLSAHWLRDTI